MKGGKGGERGERRNPSTALRRLKGPNSTTKKTSRKHVDRQPIKSKNKRSQEKEKGTLGVLSAEGPMMKK